MLLPKLTIHSAKQILIWKQMHEKMRPCKAAPPQFTYCMKYSRILSLSFLTTNFINKQIFAQDEQIPTRQKQQSKWRSYIGGTPKEKENPYVHTPRISKTPIKTQPNRRLRPEPRKANWQNPPPHPPPTHTHTHTTTTEPIFNKNVKLHCK